MSPAKSPYPNERKLVEWYLHPDKAKQTKRPEEPFDHPVTTVHESIALTLRYLTAAYPVLGEGRRYTRLRMAAGEDGTQTLFWSVYEYAYQTPIVEKGRTRTESVILYYGFDARGHLMLDTLMKPSRESPYTQSYSWPSEFEIPEDHRLMLLEKLQRLRANLFD